MYKSTGVKSIVTGKRQQNALKKNLSNNLVFPAGLKAVF
jgi:hypothetical protein